MPYSVKTTVDFMERLLDCASAGCAVPCVSNRCLAERLSTNDSTSIETSQLPFVPNPSAYILRQIENDG